jgi:bacterioferritin
MFNQQVAAQNLFLAEVTALRTRAAPHLAAGTPSSNIALLQTVLTAEIACVLRYTAISVCQEGLRNAWIGAEFQEQAKDERSHMALAAARIEQLGGTPDFTPPPIAAVPIAGPGAFARAVAENLAAETEIVAHYRELRAYFAPHDSQSAALLENIIADEETHADDMRDLLGAYVG